MHIEKAPLSDLETVYKITKTAIEHTYPHYYAKGAVYFSWNITAKTISPVTFGQAACSSVMILIGMRWVRSR